MYSGILFYMVNCMQLASQLLRTMLPSLRPEISQTVITDDKLTYIHLMHIVQCCCYMHIYAVRD